MKKFSNSIPQRLTGRHKYSFEISGNLKDKKILDVGSSYGWFEQHAIESKCLSITGIEPDKKQFYLAQKNIPKANFKIGSAIKIPESDKSFDMVVMFDVIEHIPKGTEMIALSEIIRVLKPKGSFVMSTDFDYWLAKIMDPAWYFGHRHYSKERLKHMLESSGFKIKQIEIRGRYFEMTGTILMYIFKWIFNREIPFKSFFDKKKDQEFLKNKNGFVTIFIRAEKN